MGDGPSAMRVRRPGPGAVAAVGGEVLGDEDDLAHGAAARRSAQRVDLGQDVVGRARALVAPERRDGAEAAAAVAALGDLHVGPRGAGGRAGQLEQVEPSVPACRAGRAPGARVTGTGCSVVGLEAAARQRHAEAGDQVDLGQGVASSSP